MLRTVRLPTSLFALMIRTFNLPMFPVSDILGEWLPVSAFFWVELSQVN
jgi:hypothetical protein